MFSLYFIVVLSLSFPVSESLECYQCSNVTSTKNCSSKVTCPQGQKCYTSVHGVGTSQAFDLGCKSESACLGSAGPSFVGRSTDAKNTCSQCCQADNCNGYLCSVGLQVINEVGQCANDPAFDCATISTAFNICADIHHAKVKCRKYCGLCNLVDGSWSVWSSWSSCDVTCGSGHMTRTRTCTDPVPVHGGLDCVGDSKEISACVMHTCPVHGGWSLWSPWGSCSVTCGIGLERRDRSCSNPYPSHDGDHCYGDSRDDRPCFLKACADGMWSTWSGWGACTATCLGGLQQRTRTCDNPAPTAFGHDCVGTNEESQICNNKECRNGIPISFKASHVSSLGSGTNRTLIYTNTEMNEGDGYDNSTGIFTAPETGIYSFDVQTCCIYQQIVYVSIIKDGHTEIRAHYYDYYDHICYSTSTVVPMESGNKVWVTLTTGGGLVQDANNYNVFQGTKIGV